MDIGDWAVGRPSDFLTQFDRIGPWSVDIMSIVEDSSRSGDLMASPMRLIALKG